MKKIFLILILMFVLVNVKAEEVKVDIKWIPNVYYNYKKDGLIYWGQLAYIYAGDKIAYCLDVEKKINSTVYNSSDSSIDNNLVVLAGYFGYGYNNEKTLNDYIATQKWIWKFLGWDVYFTTSSEGRGSRIDIDDYIIKINSRINRYALFSKFDKAMNLNLGETGYYNDLNGIVDNFNVINDSSNKIYINNNNLILEGNDVGNKYFMLETKYLSNYPNIIYEANNSQRIMIIGEVDNLKRRYDYVVKGASIKLNIIKDINLQLDDNDNIIEVYKNDILINTFNKSDELLIDNLDYGIYKIKFTKIAEGYELENNIIDIVIDKENTNVEKDVYLKAETIKLDINKKYGNKKLNYEKPDSGILYEIYQNNSLINTMKTDQDGNCYIELLYGDYIIKQVNTNNIDIIHDDIVVLKDDFGEDKHINIFDELDKIKIKFIGNFEDNVVDFSLKYDDTQCISENGVCLTNYLKYGTYIISNIVSEGYKNIEDINFDLTSDLDYYILDDIIYYDYQLNFIKEEEQVQNLVNNETVEIELSNNEQQDLTEDIDVNEELNDSVEQVVNEEIIDKDESVIIKLPYLGVMNGVYKVYHSNIFNCFFGRLY